MYVLIATVATDVKLKVN